MPEPRRLRSLQVDPTPTLSAQTLPATIIGRATNILWPRQQVAPTVNAVAIKLVVPVLAVTEVEPAAWLAEATPALSRCPSAAGPARGVEIA